MDAHCRDGAPGQVGSECSSEESHRLGTSEDGDAGDDQAEAVAPAATLDASSDGPAPNRRKS